MTEIQIFNRKKKPDKPISAKICSSFLCRLRGLTFQSTIPQGWGLLLVQERENRVEAAIHMLFMFCDLVVVWINTSLEVVDVQYAKAWHLSYIPKKPAKYVLELSQKHIHDFCIGDQLRFES
jgi:uncharacterized membrane protein (UPF0127 family)